jgi:hypothetical protein
MIKNDIDIKNIGGKLKRINEAYKKIRIGL